MSGLSPANVRTVRAPGNSAGVYAGHEPGGRQFPPRHVRSLEPASRPGGKRAEGVRFDKSRWATTVEAYERIPWQRNPWSAWCAEGLCRPGSIQRRSLGLSSDLMHRNTCLICRPASAMVMITVGNVPSIPPDLSPFAVRGHVASAVIVGIQTNDPLGTFPYRLLEGKSSQSLNG